MKHKLTFNRMFAIVVSGLICLLGSFFVQATDCPDLWIPYSGSCYRFGHQALTFFEAEHYCQQHQSRLVHIETPEEDAFLKEELSYFQVDRFWIGITDDDIEATWVWYGTDTKAEYTNWYPGQPSSSGNNEDCGEVIRYSASVTKWNDVDCHALRTPICEKTGNFDNGIIG